MIEIKWKKTKNMSYVGYDKEKNKYFMPPGKDVCSCELPSGHVGFDWTPEEAYKDAINNKNFIK